MVGLMRHILPVRLTSRAEGDTLSGGLADQRPARELQSGGRSLDHRCR